MKIFDSPEFLQKRKSPISIAAGFFDGVHAGHKLVLNAAVNHARATCGESWVLTFARHPLAVLAPSKRPPLLFTLEQRLAAFEALGMQNVLLQPFTRELAVTEPEDFIAELCGDGSTPSMVFCGENWRFGRKASGTPELLKKIGRKYGLGVQVIPYAYYQGEIICSTRIRNSILNGNLEDATEMLQKPVEYSGKIIHGKALAGKLGFPTANIEIDAEVLPPRGVYDVLARLDGESVQPAIANFGICPTIGGSEKLTLEVHIPKETRNLYGRNMTVAFRHFLREEKTFSSINELCNQIKTDIEKLQLQ